MIERDHIIKVLQQVKKASNDKDTVKLKELSNQTIHSAIERKHYREQPGWKTFFNKYQKCLDKAIINLKKGDEDAFGKDLESIRKAINDLSGKLKFYIKDVFDKAKINKASIIYEHGISMEKTAKLLGVSIWELANYAGQKSEISDVNLNLTQNVQTRIKTAMEIFG